MAPWCDHAKLSPAFRVSLKCIAAGFTVFPFFLLLRPGRVGCDTLRGFVLPFAPSKETHCSPLGKAVLTLHQNVFPLQNT